MSTEIYLSDLQNGPLYPFANWKEVKDLIPLAAHGVYTIWKNDELIYAGMSGRGLTEIDIENAYLQKKVKGLRGRLGSHQSGRRSGDQFCVYVADRLVLKSLSEEQIQMVSEGSISLDQLTREYIYENLCFRFVVTNSSEESFDLEDQVRSGAIGQMPYLNSKQ